MQLRIIDAFTGWPRADNPAAVVLLDNHTWPPGHAQSASLDERCA
jgi:hypothetical protein